MRFSYYKRPLFLLLMCWLAGILAFRIYGAAGASCDPGPLPAYGVRVEGRIAQYPAHSRGSWRFILEASALDGEAADISFMVYARDMGGASYDDKVVFTAGLAAPFNFAIPGNLDWRGYLAERGIIAEARVDRLEILQKAPFIIRRAAAFRANALKIFDENFTADRASVMAGIVLGEKKNVSDELKTAFQDSGAMHLLVASGSNVGFVTFVVYFLCSHLKIRKKYSGLLALLCAGFYVLAAGLEAPLVRGYIMFLAALGGYLLDRDSGIFQGLIIACLAILLTDPSALFDAGFRMSFIASYGITAGMTLWDGLIRLKGPLRSLSRVLMVSFFAQVGLYPLMALYFHKISLISIVSNVLLVPASGIIMGLGFVTLISSWSGILVTFVSSLTGYGAGAFIWLVKAFAAFRYSYVLVSPPSAITLAAFFVFVFILLHAPLIGFGKRRLYMLAAVPLFTILAAGFLPVKSLVSVFSDSDTRSVAVRHGGDGLFLFNPGINGRKLSNCVLHYGFRSVEGVFISTLARRDWGGLGELAGQMKIKKVALPYGALPEELSEIMSALAGAGTRIERVWPQDRILFKGLEIRPDWGSGKDAVPETAGYTGRDPEEGLDWSLEVPEFAVRVMADGSRVAVRRGDGEERILKNRAGEAMELEL